MVIIAMDIIISPGSDTMSKQKVHFVAPYIQNPIHAIDVVLVGAGGNGSQMLSVLARIHTSLLALGKKGLSVTVYDDDTVSEANFGRQLFSLSEVGLNKAVTLVSRFNRFYGTGWHAQARRFNPRKDSYGNIIISCVDNVSTRVLIGKNFKDKSQGADENICWYWLDLGNAQKCGQVVLGSANINQPPVKIADTLSALPLPTEELDFESVDEKNNGPSCSLAEALRKQDLFVNSSLSQFAGSILWSLFREDAIDKRGFYMNLDKLMVMPIRI